MNTSANIKNPAIFKYERSWKIILNIPMTSRANRRKLMGKKKLLVEYFFLERRLLKKGPERSN